MLLLGLYYKGARLYWSKLGSISLFVECIHNGSINITEKIHGESRLIDWAHIVY